MGLFMACTTVKYATSDHYNGSHFFNPWGVNNKKSFWDVLKWKISGSAEKWPESVKNPPTQLLPRPSSGFTVTWVNHSTFLLQTPHLNILTDPIWSDRSSPVSFAGPERVRAPGISWEELPKIDVVVISHNHYDHLDVETLLKLEKRDQPHFYVALGDKDWLSKKGLTNVSEMDWWQVIERPNLRLTFMPAQHWSARSLWDKNESLWGAWGIEVEGKRIYHAGDTGLGPHFKETRERWGAPDLALLPIGAYRPRWFMKDMHMNPEDAVEAFKLLETKEALGMHFGTFQLTDEKWDQPENDLRKVLENEIEVLGKFHIPIIGVSRPYP